MRGILKSVPRTQRKNRSDVAERQLTLSAIRQIEQRKFKIPEDSDILKNFNRGTYVLESHLIEFRTHLTKIVFVMRSIMKF